MYEGMIRTVQRKNEIKISQQTREVNTDMMVQMAIVSSSLLAHLLCCSLGINAHLSGQEVWQFLRYVLPRRRVSLDLPPDGN